MLSRKKPSWDKILKWIDKITGSKTPICSHFKRKCRTTLPPFSYTQYKRYINHIKKNGRQHPPSNREGRPCKLGKKEQLFLKAACTCGSPTIKKLQTVINDEFNVLVSRNTLVRTLDSCIQGGHISVIEESKKMLKKKQSITSHNAYAGFELIVAIAIHLRWPQRVISLIRKSLKRMKKEFPINKSEGKLISIEKKHRENGKFTAKYNERKDVKQKRFSSVNDRRTFLSWYRSTIHRDSDHTLERKVIAMLSLPAISEGGRVRNLDLSGRQELHHFTGRSCKHATIFRFMSELKIVGASHELLRDLPPFWKDLWGADLHQFAKKGMLCFYIDGNVQPVWSHMRIKNGHVTMLGRVMGCLEHVFIHDVFGRPIYFETYSGNAPLNEYVQSAFKKIEDCLDLKDYGLTVNRCLVVDAGANGVETLRELSSDSSHYHITRLDSNQWKPWKQNGPSHESRYKYGDADLYDGFMELRDSKKTGDNLYLTRFVRVRWDSLNSDGVNRESVLVTDYPKEIVSASDIVHTYFNRWPCQEGPFREEKAVASLSRIAGYGKKIVDDKEKENERNKLTVEIKKLSVILEPYFSDVMIVDKKISAITKKIISIKKHVVILEDGNRDGQNLNLLENLEKNLKNCQKEKANLRQDYIKEVGKYERLRKEWKKIDTDLKTYTIDVELDQIMTYFRSILIHIYAYFLQKYLNGVKMNYESFVHRIVHLGGTINEDSKTRLVQLVKNNSDPEAMSAVKKAIKEINKIGIMSMNNKKYQFELT